LEDYYAILGLDQGASAESIKLAYRRLARESHPDRFVNSSEADKSALSARMAQLNVAYSVLSDAGRRREYDEKTRIMSKLNGGSAAQDSKTATVTQTFTQSVTQTVSHTATKPGGSSRIAAAHDSDLTLVRDFSRQLRANLLASKEHSWEEKVLEGFDWGLESVSWSSHFCVAARGFATLDLAAAKKFANYAEVVVSRGNRAVRKSHFLFLLPFQQLNQWQSVAAEFNRLFADDKHKTMSGVPVKMVLFDAQRGRTLRVGPTAAIKPLDELLLCLAPDLVKPRG
jgi:curved DNA-binding protein CbpA